MTTLPDVILRALRQSTRTWGDEDDATLLIHLAVIDHLGLCPDCEHQTCTPDCPTRTETP